jgi:hypothetical protein
MISILLAMRELSGGAAHLVDASLELGRKRLHFFFPYRIVRDMVNSY